MAKLQAKVNEIEGRTTRGTQRSPRPVATIRASHHKLAQMIAGGMKYTEAAKVLGYHPVRIQQLLADPTFQHLIAEYRDLDMTETGDYLSTLQSVVMSNALNAELQIQQKLSEAEAEGETLPTRDLISISRDGADRLGFGKRSVQTNVNLDFASMLDKAIKRSSGAKTILGESVEVQVPSPLVQGPQPSLPSPSIEPPDDLPPSSLVGGRPQEVAVTGSPPGANIRRRI